MCVLLGGRIMTSDLIKVSEASALIGLDKVYIYDWGRRGLLEVKLVKTEEQLRGFLHVSKSDVIRVAESFKKNGLPDIVTVPEAAKLTDRDTKNIYTWIRLGYLKAEKRLGPRSKDGNLYVSREEVIYVANNIYQGMRYDVGVRYLAPLKRERKVTKVRRKVEFEDWQLEVARRVFGKC